MAMLPTKVLLVPRVAKVAKVNLDIKVSRV